MQHLLLRSLVAAGLMALGWVGAFSNERMAFDLTTLQSQGPRIAGTPSAFAAGEYLAAEARKAGYTVEFQEFSYQRTRDLGSTLVVGGTAYDNAAIAGSPARKVEAPLIAVPGLGRAEDYAGLEVKDKIVVVRRGVIPFLEKARQAAERGALAMVVVNTDLNVVRGTYGGSGPIPGLIVSGREGEALFGLSGTTATLESRMVDEQVRGRNVIAKRGTAAPKVVVGGHYDSVPGSPGANDNASGTVTVLELARELANTSLAGDIWFMWFDGEEDGLWGSRKFVQEHQEVVRGLRAMLNLDMVGVKVSASLGISGDAELIKLAQGIEPSVTSMGSGGGGGSDHAPFAQAGVPVMFFHWGIDPNYHQPTDKVAHPGLMIETGLIAKGVLERILTAQQ